MSKRITRRGFARATAATTIGFSSLEVATGAPQAGGAKQPAEMAPVLEVRPYQLMCIICRMGEGRTKDLGDERLNQILAAVQADPKIPIRLRLNTESVYGYQNPGHGDDSPGGELFNIKRDLDIVQQLGLIPGDTRPAVDMFERVFLNLTTAKGICGYETVTGETWQGCPRAASGNYEKGHAKGLTAVIPPRDEEEKARFKKTSADAVYEAKTLQIRPHHLMCMSCFYGGRMDNLAPIKEDNLFEAIDAIHKNPEIPVTLVPGCCMICPPCSRYEPKSGLCLGGRSMALRDQKKDLDTLQKLGLKYGDTLPAKDLYKLLYERIASTREICGYGDGEERAPEWSVCGAPEGQTPEGKATYVKARAANLGIEG